MHSDSITFDRREEDSKVLFEPFMGISPLSYRAIFQKGKKRKNALGDAVQWYDGKPKPRVEDRGVGYIQNEESGITSAFKKA